MPIFDYLCRACGHQFDALQKAGSGALRKCPACGALRLAKCLSTPRFHLRGKDWRKPAAADRRHTVTRKGHMLDSGPVHSHDRDGAGHAPTAHTHSHGEQIHTHRHGPGHTHGHRH